MREKRWIKDVLVAVGMAVMFVSCGVSHPSSSSFKKTSIIQHPSPKLSPETSFRYNYFFFEAMNQQNAGHYDAAFDLLNRSLDINPNAAEAWFYLSMYQGEFGHDSLALASMEKQPDCAPTTPRIKSSWRSITSMRGNTTRRRRSMSNWPRISVSVPTFCKCSSGSISKARTTTV